MRKITCPHGITPKRNCRECQREYYREWRRKNIKKDREWHREWAKNNPHTVQKYKENFLMSNGTVKIKVEQQAQKFPLGSQCETCPDNDIKTENLERHHFDYDYPELFVTCCEQCHYFLNRSTEIEPMYRFF